jgi:hypothetical protein
MYLSRNKDYTSGIALLAASKRDVDDIDMNTTMIGKSLQHDL